jgi:formate hydrogenlyase subunit 4
MNTELPLVLELAEPKLIAGDVDIQLSSRTSTSQKSNTFSLAGVLSDIAADVAVDDVIA